MKTLVLAFALAFTAYSNAAVVKPLSKSDRLGQVAKAIGTQLSDNNIANGTTDLSAGQLTEEVPSSKDALSALGRKAFREAYAKNEGEAFGKYLVAVKVGTFANGDGAKGTVTKMAEAIAESNDYDTSNSENIDSQRKYVWAVLRQMPVDNNTLVVQVTTKVDREGRDGKQSVQYFLLVNSDGKAVQLYTFQGSM